MAIYALENGLHVLNEKSAGVYTEQVKKLNEVAESKKMNFLMQLCSINVITRFIKK